MRISGIEVTDFKAIRYAKLSDMETQPFTVLVGQNGVGKTAILDALYLLTRAPLLEPQPDLVRLGESGAEVTLSFSLSDTEFEQVDRYHRSVYGKPAEQMERYRRVARIDKTGNISFADSSVVATVFDPVFRSGHSFPDVTLLGAGRGRTPGVGVANVVAGVLPGGPSSGSSPADYLTSSLTALDYRSLLAARQGGNSQDDYGDLARVFLAATGKTLLRPQPLGGFGATRIEVALMDGQHPISGLSSGETGFLGLLSSLYQSASDGGVLLLDEPELHLHPVLQTALLRVVRDLAPRTQTIIVTHAVKIAAAAHPSQVYQILHNRQDQAQRAAHASSLAGVIAGMGIDEADLLGKGVHLVVEGLMDEKYLGQLLPDEMERVHVTVAGDCKQVLAHHRMLAAGPGSLPWLCLTDRDLLSEAEVARREVTYPNLHVWPGRALESMLLDPTLLAAVLRTVGRPTSIDEAQALLQDAADRLMDAVVTDLLQASLAREFPLPRPDGSRGDGGLKEFYAASARAMKARGESVEAVREREAAAVQDRWEQDRFVLVDPKKALGSLARQVNLFRKTEDLTTALIARAADDENVRPRALEEFRLRLLRTIGGASSVHHTSGPGARAALQIPATPPSGGPTS